MVFGWKQRAENKSFYEEPRVGETRSPPHEAADRGELGISGLAQLLSWFFFPGAAIRVIGKVWNNSAGTSHGHPTSSDG